VVPWDPMILPPEVKAEEHSSFVSPWERHGLGGHVRKECGGGGGSAAVAVAGCSMTGHWPPIGMEVLGAISISRLNKGVNKGKILLISFTLLAYLSKAVS
jgi:hypothetical protein